MIITILYDGVKRRKGRREIKACHLIEVSAQTNEHRKLQGSAVHFCPAFQTHRSQTIKCLTQKLSSVVQNSVFGRMSKCKQNSFTTKALSYSLHSP